MLMPAMQLITYFPSTYNCSLQTGMIAEHHLPPEVKDSGIEVGQIVIVAGGGVHNGLHCMHCAGSAVCDMLLHEKPSTAQFISEPMQQRSFKLNPSYETSCARYPSALGQTDIFLPRNQQNKELHPELAWHVLRCSK